MNKEEYQKYLQSDHWKRVKAQKTAEIPTSKPKICFICNTWKYLNLHHLNYQSIGKETSQDTLWLCRDCHGFVHRMAAKANTTPHLDFIKGLQSEFNRLKSQDCNWVVFKKKKKKLKRPCELKKVQAAADKPQQTISRSVNKIGKVARTRQVNPRLLSNCRPVIERSARID